jgi:hypothetical protein
LNAVLRITQEKLMLQETQAILQASQIKDTKMWSNLLAAIVLYTFDLSILFKGYAAEENFYFRLNKVLQKRDAGDIQKCTEYLHYLMKGLEALPAYTPEDRKQGFLWRGVNR